MTDAVRTEDVAPGRRRGARLGGLRARILVPFVAALGIATLGSVLVQRQVLLNQLDDRINAELAQEASELQRLVGGRGPDGECLGGVDAQGRCEVGRDPVTGEPFGNDVAAVFDTFLRRNIPGRHETMITFVDGRPYKVPAVRSADAAAADRHLYDLASVTQPQRGERQTEDGLLRFLAVPVAGTDEQVRGVFVVAQFVDRQRDEVREPLQLMAVTELFLLLVASALAYFLAGRLLAPVRQVTETARAISESDLSRRIAVEGHSEVADLARTFNQMLDRLEAAFGSQRQFVDDAGHELRTPITIIRGHLELLGDDPTEQRETLALVTDELDRMNRMVDDLLLLARAGRPELLALETVDVASLTHDLHAKAAGLAPRAWEVERCGRGRIVADRQRLTQAMMQLAQNASEHTVDGSPIWLGSSVEDGVAAFWVRDTGPGVPQRDAERIFERFSRGSRTRRTDGAGLGLSIVRAIAEAHGGRVDLVSSPGAGATFTIVIPVDPPQEHVS